MDGRKERIMRLIEADALVKIKFHGYPELEIVPSGVNAEAYKRGWNDAIDAIIECEPSIDAFQEIPDEQATVDLNQKTAIWEKKSFYNSQEVVCSKCGADGIWYWNYCPACGAKMEDGADT